jgi:hypothetical protein
MDLKSYGPITVETKIINRTRLYMAPVLNAVDNQLPSKINLTDITMWGTNDIVYAKHKQMTQYCLFILHKVNEHLGSYIEYCKSRPFFVDDYIFNLREIDYHMSVIRLPRTWKKSYDAFVDGRFSQMYTDKQLKRVKISPRFYDGRPNAIYQVLTRDEKYREKFEEKLEELYGTTVAPDDAEYDSHNFSHTLEVFNATTTPGFKDLNL